MDSKASGQVPIGEDGDIRKLSIAVDNALQNGVSASAKEDENYSHLRKICEYIVNLCKEHPDLCRFILLTVGGAITVPILLQIAGFGILGPVAGSLAAAWQSAIGDVAAGSFFAWLQSLGMSPATAATTGALIGFGGYMWVELQKVLLPGGDDRKNSTGGGRRDLNPMYRGYMALQRGLRF